jgi:hypothetical protein
LVEGYGCSSSTFSNSSNNGTHGVVVFDRGRITSDDPVSSVTVRGVGGNASGVGGGHNHGVRIVDSFSRIDSSGAITVATRLTGHDVAAASITRSWRRLFDGWVYPR